ncbi:signal recognition particle protein [Candidatus Haliotispira prima]|uniref:Signal recognition particle protein n=1 Tax=Candidatus Haliotispira prima TaxID=3034016 RepID=A0ABY8MJZ1_9SPIO|nr:signal recognition particle protein [Candidatus Haliotispira prima]
MLESIAKSFEDITKRLSGNNKITDKNIQESLDEIQIAMLEADVNLRVVRRFINNARKEAQGEEVLRSVNPGQQFVKIIYDRMVKLLGSDEAELKLKGPDTISSILILGLQGAGKTTTTAKLAHKLKEDGRNVLLVACDLQRPAAVEQLKVLAGQVGVGFFGPDDSENGKTSPAKVAEKALKLAKQESYNTVLFDTAGRLHIDEELMGELEAVKKAVNPVESIFVADSMTGQGAADVAAEFNDKIEISGVILTKFDSETRGGAALSIQSIVKKPIKYIGVGEKISDLDTFYPQRIASRILGMGDVISLVEKARELTTEKDAERLEKKIRNKEFTLQDMLEQIRQMKKMGSVDQILELMPGMTGKAEAIKDRINDKDISHKEAIILSMTKQEKQNYKIIGPSRRRRIANGAGVNIVMVNRLLKEFEKNRIMMRKMLKNKGMQANLMKQMGL